MSDTGPAVGQRDRFPDTPGGSRASVATVVTLRPTASPLPIGLLALAIGSLVLTGLQLSWLTPTQQQPLALCLLAFVVPIQFLGFVFAVLDRDEGAASGMVVLAGSWFAIGLVLLMGVPGSTSSALGLLLVTAGAALALPALVAAVSKPLVCAVFAVAGGRFVLSGWYEFAGWHPVDVAAGGLGIALTALAGYAALAFALEIAYGRPVLPTLRSPVAAGSGDSDAIAEQATTEAGVRSEL